MGNGNGVAGFGEGKSEDSAKAIEKATLVALASQFSIQMHENRTLHSDITFKLQSTKVNLFTACQGYGVVGNATIREVARVFGLKDLGSKISGSTNPMNVVKSCFDALKRAKSPQDIAKLRGLKVVDVCGRYYDEK